MMVYLASAIKECPVMQLEMSSRKSDILGLSSVLIEQRYIIHAGTPAVLQNSRCYATSWVIMPSTSSCGGRGVLLQTVLLLIINIR
jgi:hypothetical protein